MDYLERNRDFKGVWIPRSIWLNDNLTMLEKVILVEVDSLDNAEHCTAGNEYLSQFCQCSESKVSGAIKKLQDLGYIEVIAFDGRHRRIRSCLLESTKQPPKKYEADSEKVKAINIASNLASNLAIYNDETSSSYNPSTSKEENFSEETTLTNAAPPSDPEEKYNDRIKEIVAYLNEKTDSSYRANTPNTRKHIIARLKQEYTVDDFKHVIDVKCAEWKGTDFEKFLRPDTLFGSKFENYLQQKMPAAKTAARAGQPNTQYKQANLADIDYSEAY